MAICQLFQEVLDTSELDPHCKIKHTGEWRVLTVRTFSTGDGASLTHMASQRANEPTSSPI